MNIRLIINGQVLSATLLDSVPAREFLAQLPLTLQLEDYAATEKIAQLPRRLSVSGEPEGITPAPGDIAFYAPWGNLAIFHKPFGYSKGLIRLGRIEGGLQALRAEGPLKIRIESSQGLDAQPGYHNEVSYMGIKRIGTQASIKGPADWFTGAVRIGPLNAAPAPSRVSCAAVTFEPGARTAWHTHPLGQTLIVTAGLGWTQCEGGPIVEIRAGDVIWCPPGHKHWHGASPTTAMTHIAVQEALEGRNVDWLEHVTDREYLAGPPD